MTLLSYKSYGLKENNDTNAELEVCHPANE